MERNHLTLGFEKKQPTIYVSITSNLLIVCMESCDVCGVLGDAQELQLKETPFILYKMVILLMWEETTSGVDGFFCRSLSTPCVNPSKTGCRGRLLSLERGVKECMSHEIHLPRLWDLGAMRDCAGNANVEQDRTSCSGLDAGTNGRKAKKPGTEHPAAGGDGRPEFTDLGSRWGTVMPSWGDPAGHCLQRCSGPVRSIITLSPRFAGWSDSCTFVPWNIPAEASNLMSCLLCRRDKGNERLARAGLKIPALAQDLYVGPIQLCADRRLDL